MEEGEGDISENEYEKDDVDDDENDKNDGDDGNIDASSLTWIRRVCC